MCRPIHRLIRRGVVMRSDEFVSDLVKFGILAVFFQIVSKGLRKMLPSESKTIGLAFKLGFDRSPGLNLCYFYFQIDLPLFRLPKDLHPVRASEFQSRCR